MDFTQEKYRRLLGAFREAGYAGLPFVRYLQGGLPERFVLLRHDVDLRPGRSLAIARIEQEEGMWASYYFRAVPESWDDSVIREIAAMGHEVGYHYESLTTCKGNREAALRDFERNLTRLRALVPVQTVCMHGSPRSSWDSRTLWAQGGADYRDYGLLGEPYFDIDFSEVFYLTDTGRRWDGFRVSRRDRIERYQDEWQRRGLVYHGTDDILRALEQGTFPPRLMLTTHPQRWCSGKFPWMKELVLQKAKNLVKYFLVKYD